MQIRFENRLLRDIGCICKITVDGTDCPIEAPQPFDPANCSHKLNGPGVRYEIGIGIQIGWIVLVNGPFQPGPNTGNVIATQKGLWDVLNNLSPTEKFLADAIYSGWRAETPNGLNNEDQWMKARARARHENVNARFKRFGCLKTAFLHGDRHRECFHAIVR